MDFKEYEIYFWYLSANLGEHIQNLIILPCFFIQYLLYSIKLYIPMVNAQINAYNLSQGYYGYKYAKHYGNS